jgi:aspartyl-tRNA(Asn)/glutamyl-tRNA(Gln) amidotransferase subunit A
VMWAALFNEPTPGRPSKLSAAVLTDAFAASDPDVVRACRAAIEALRKLGLRVEERSGFPEEADANSLLVMQAEAARTHSRLSHDERVDAVLRKRLGKGLAIGDYELAMALAARDDMRARLLAEQFRDADIVLLPVMPIRTPLVAAVNPASPDFKARTLYALSRFTRFVNYLDLPALALPAGFDGNDMPVGLQVVGRQGSELLLLALGIHLQAETDWHSRVPTAISEIVTHKGMVA